MEEKFREFFRDKRYIKIKNYMFNYINRKFWVRKAYDKYNFSTGKILDIGSGISPVSPEPKKTLFIDISPEAVNFLNSLGYIAKVGSITKISEKANTFEFVLCSEVLEHVENYKKALDEIHKILKNNGFLILTVPVYMKYWNVDDEFVEHYRRFEPAKFKKELINAKFKIIEEKPIGSILERKLTLYVVKLFKKTKSQKINFIKYHLIILVNLILYLIIRISLIFTSKKTTSIMMYVCKKHI